MVGYRVSQAGVGRTVTIGRGGFGWESVWRGGWFWVEVQGLVFTVGKMNVLSRRSLRISVSSVFKTLLYMLAWAWLIKLKSVFYLRDK